MKVNTKDRVLFDLYSYDIEKCHYILMERLGLDLSQIDKDDKVKRNIQIGQMGADKKNLIPLLRKLTKSIINENIRANNIQPDEIIISSYDGIISTKLLKINMSDLVPLNLVSVLSVLITNWDKTSYISRDNSTGTVTIKGVPLRYKEMDDLLSKLVTTNFSSKITIFKRMDLIQNQIVKSNNYNMFRIPVDDNYSIFYLKKYGKIKVPNLMKGIDTIDIDKWWYFNFYIKPFTDSISYQFC